MQHTWSNLDAGIVAPFAVHCSMECGGHEFLQVYIWLYFIWYFTSCQHAEIVPRFRSCSRMSWCKRRCYLDWTCCTRRSMLKWWRWRMYYWGAFAAHLSICVRDVIQVWALLWRCHCALARMTLWNLFVFLWRTKNEKICFLVSNLWCNFDCGGEKKEKKETRAPGELKLRRRLISAIGMHVPNGIFYNKKNW